MSASSGARTETRPSTSPSDYILVVDDEEQIRNLITRYLAERGHLCRSAATAEDALSLAAAHPDPALVITDIRMPGVGGVELLHRLKKMDPKVQVVMVSSHQDLETVRRCLREGAYDYLLKPFDWEILSNTVSRALERHSLLRENDRYRVNLERLVLEQTEEIRETRDIALITLAKLAESRDSTTGLHLERIAAYSRRLAEELRDGAYAGRLSQEYIEQLAKSSPLHDIGKVAIPDSILCKPGPLSSEEFRFMKTHSTIGGDTLRSVLDQFETHGFLIMAMEIAYSHHERWDGCGYPQGLKGEEVPLAARIVALVDSYDTLTSDRPYKKAVPHREAVQRLAVDRGKHFEPAIVDAFLACHVDFESIREEVSTTGSDLEEPQPDDPPSREALR
ncbi:MAG: HD domain-containing phosphohydrolase [Thermoanaerobaculia bacterium]